MSVSKPTTASRSLREMADGLKAESKLRHAENDAGLKPLTEWLESWGSCKLAWSVDIPGVGAASAYIVNMHVVIVQVFRDSEGILRGWDAYVAATQQNDIAATLKALDEHCSD